MNQTLRTASRSGSIAHDTGHAAVEGGRRARLVSSPRLVAVPDLHPRWMHGEPSGDSPVCARCYPPGDFGT